MLSPQLDSWNSKNHYRVDDDVVYGVHEGCGFSVTEDDGGLLFIFMLSPRDDNAFDDIEDALSNEGGELAEGQVGDVDGYLAVFFDQNRGPISARTMNRLLDFVVDQFRPCGFRAPNVCVKCGARANKRSFLDGMVQPLCAECSAQNKQKRRAAAEETRRAKERQEEEKYAAQYSPIVPDSSKYDDSYDEYAGMSTEHSDYDSQYSGSHNDHNDRYDDPYDNRYSDTRYDDEPQDKYNSFEPAPIAFSDDSEDDYREIMGDEGEHSSATVSETHIEGSAGMGLLGAFLGALAGVIPYVIIALVINFHMAALCFPAGMLAVWFYTLLKGRKSMVYGMTVSAAISAVISFLTMFLCMVVSYMDESRNFSQAIDYIFTEQTTFFILNTVFALLASIFGALFMVVVMAKYIDSNQNS